MPAATPFARLEQRVNRATMQHLANASVLPGAGGAALPAILDSDIDPASPFADVLMQTAHVLSMVPPPGGLVEGDTLTVTCHQWPGGQACVVSTAVNTDSSGFAVFGIAPL